MHPSTPRVLLLVSFSITAACSSGGGDDGGGGDDDGDPSLVDAGGGDDDPDRPDGGGPAACLAADSYAGFTEPEAFSGMMEGSTTPDFIGLTAALDAAAKPDIVALELYKGFGPFATGEIVPGTY